MATTPAITNTQKRRFDIPLNVGLQGGDLPARYYSTGVILALSILSAPPVHFSPVELKLAALLASMSGTMLLMAGLVFSQKTHYAGVLLIPVPFMLLWLAGAGLAWLGVLVGLAFAGWGVQNLVTKRCAINKLLGVNSCGQ